MRRATTVMHELLLSDTDRLGDLCRIKDFLENIADFWKHNRNDLDFGIIRVRSEDELSEKELV
jgi:hypothetical protein